MTISAKTLRKLQPKIRRKLESALAKLEGGTPWAELGGKRLRHDRTVISIPFDRKYRLVGRDLGGGKFEPISAGSHESYNATKPGG